MYSLVVKFTFSVTKCKLYNYTFSVTFCIIQGHPHIPSTHTIGPDPLSNEKFGPDPNRSDPWMDPNHI